MVRQQDPELSGVECSVETVEAQPLLLCLGLQKVPSTVLTGPVHHLAQGPVAQDRIFVCLGFQRKKGGQAIARMLPSLCL